MNTSKNKEYWQLNFGEALNKELCQQIQTLLEEKVPGTLVMTNTYSPGLELRVVFPTTNPKNEEILFQTLARTGYHFKKPIKANSNQAATIFKRGNDELLLYQNKKYITLAFSSPQEVGRAFTVLAVNTPEQILRTEVSLNDYKIVLKPGLGIYSFLHYLGYQETND